MSSVGTRQSYVDFFRYTSGRWLWDEEQQLRERFSPFNVPELHKVAASSVEANKCIATAKLAVGSFNKTFSLTMDNSMTVIAQIPHPIAGPHPKLQPWNTYGSLYYASENIPGAVAAEVIGDVPTEVRNTVMHRFAIGPVAERDFWNKERATMRIDRGPWNQPREFVVSLAHRELEWIQRYAMPKPADDPLVSAASQNSPSCHITLLQKYLKVAPFLLPDDPVVVAPHKWHADLHAGNIFVDKGKISSVIDWQGIWASIMMSKPPANFKNLEPDEKFKIRKHMSSSIILYLYEKQTSKENPLLSKVSILVMAEQDDIIPLRESLIRVEKYWNEFETDAPCPIHFTESELQTFPEESEGWNDVQEFWDSTPNDLYDEAVALFTELRELGLKSMVGKEREDFKEQTQWVEKT
ncbi:hypothetical protein BDV27DRAFT_141444 [Aspergillus caelatus]|uniref:Altered inheritance of mitochondria protein 9, mitochondrial n=1 Tax=Aspergillus caelatus TaxID=61420 RepID=A0A5N7AHB7_9EURO|nr:uncharacterized protein BDV27DRAFT_141444 [Aspergillus caelatus]KAE8369252.1 hypothetical protein BDV27DRAFT_141444 [Aspergillus caelatus]